MRRYVVLLALAVLLSACGPGQLLGPTITPTPTETPTPTPEPTATATPDPCTDQNVIVPTVRDINLKLQDFVDIGLIAETTPRNDLAPLLERMQAIYREVERLSLPPCMQEMQSYLVEGMGLILDAFLGYAANGSNSEYEATLTEASEILEMYGELANGFIDQFD